MLTRWLPDCRNTVTWGGGTGGAVVSIGGATAVGQGPRTIDNVLDQSAVVSPGTALGADRALYCARASTGVEVRARDLEHQSDQVLATLPATVTACNVHASVDGKRAIVLAHRETRQVAFAEPNATLLTPPEAWWWPSVQIDSHTVLGTHRPDGNVTDNGSLMPQMLTDATAAGAIAHARIDLTTGTSTASPTCQGESGDVLYGGAIAHVVRTVTPPTIDLQADGTCATIRQFPLLPDSDWIGFACRGTTCWAFGYRESKLSLYVLGASGPTSLVTISDVIVNAFLAPSPDGTKIAMAAYADASIAVVDLAHPQTIRRVALPGATPAMQVLSVTWTSDGAALLAQLYQYKGKEFGLYRVALDGTVTLLPVAPDDWNWLDPDSGTGAALMTRRHVDEDLYQLDIE